MLNIDKPALMRAAGLLRAFRDNDQATFEQILMTDDETTAWRTFCAVFAYADRFADALATQMEITPAAVVDDAMPKLAALIPGEHL